MNPDDTGATPSRERLVTGWQRAIAGMADNVDAGAVFLYAIVIAGLGGMFVIAARLLTLEVDEAQILLSTAQAFGVDVPVTANFGRPTITTGGLHLLVHGLLARVTMDVFTHRLVSLAVAAGLLALAYRLLRSLGHPAGKAMAGTALFAAVPGFVTQAGLAMGEVIAALFMIGAGLHWLRRGMVSWSAAAVTGLLLGTACATRVNCVAAIPGFLAYVVLVPGTSGRPLLKALLAATIAGLVVGLAVSAYYLSATVVTANDAQNYLGATGLNAAKPLGRMIRSIPILNEHLSLLVLAGIVGGWVIVHQRDRSSASAPDSNVAGLLLFMGLAMLGAWLLLAPIAHLRYLWPALPCIWLAGIVLMLGEWRTEGSAATRLTLHAIVLAACGYALIADFLVIANSESLTVAYQAMGVSPRLSPPPDERFRAGADQRHLARFVADQDRTARFFTPIISFSFPISYLSGRRVQPTWNVTGQGAEFILLSPPDYTVWHPEPIFHDWLRLYTTLAFRSGGYAAFRISHNAPTPPQGWFSVGKNDFSEDQIDRCIRCPNNKYLGDLSHRPS